MAITDDHVAVLRAFLAGDFDEHDRLLERLRKAPDPASYATLIAAAFLEAVERRYHDGYSRADIIRFVADARERFDQSGRDIDPIAAERIMLVALDTAAEPIDDLSDDTVTGTQIVLLGALVTAERPDNATIDELVAKARMLADQISN